MHKKLKNIEIKHGDKYEKVFENEDCYIFNVSVYSSGYPLCYCVIEKRNDIKGNERMPNAYDFGKFAFTFVNFERAKEFADYLIEYNRNRLLKVIKYSQIRKCADSSHQTYIPINHGSLRLYFKRIIDASKKRRIEFMGY